MSAFDQLQKNTYDIVSTNFGDDASWCPAANPSATMSGKVLLKEPTTDIELGQVTYTPGTAIMEYYPAIFPGLQDSVNHGVIEEVIVNGTEYYVRAVPAKYDGKVIIAVLQIK